MYIRHITGRLGEDEAINYLKKQNYTIIERNFKCKQGEIDIIAKDNKTNELVFIEVKTRTNFNYGKPIDAVTEIKQNHIINATRYYLYKKNLENQYIRFDVITIYKNNVCHYNNCDFNIKK